MPNWVRNKITIEAKNADEIIKNLLTKDGDKIDLDFNKIKQMPESLNISAGTITNVCAQIYINSVNNKERMKYLTALVSNNLNVTFVGEKILNREIEKLLDDKRNNKPLFKSKQEILDYGHKALDNLFNYGSMDWYDWCIKNWGTKWNACNTIIKDNTITFETAWDPVPKLFEMLSQKYPDAKLHYEFADEQIDQYCGQWDISQGKIVNGKIFSPKTEETLNFGLELWPENKQDYKYDAKKKKYVYDDKNME